VYCSTLEIQTLLKFIMGVFPTLVKNGLAPSVWSGASNKVKAFVYMKILEVYPFVDLCDGFWKVHLIVTRSYADFTRHKGQGDSARLRDSRSRERSTSTAPASGKRIKREHVSSALSKPPTSSSPATKDGGTECKQITLLLAPLNSVLQPSWSPRPATSSTRWMWMTGQLRPHRRTRASRSRRLHAPYHRVHPSLFVSSRPY
jgi:hypothetical protein